MTLELILSTHEQEMPVLRAQRAAASCRSSATSIGVDDETYFDGRNDTTMKSTTPPPTWYRDNNKCILCRRCVAACAKLQGVGVIGANEPGLQHPHRLRV